MSTELKPSEVRSTRRQFLQQATALGVATIAPGILLYQTGRATAAGAATQPTRWGLLIDTNALDEAAVDTFVTACQREHGWRVEIGSRTDAQWVRKVKLTATGSAREHFLPLMCQHCEQPPCVDVCPTGASFKRADGIVLVNKHTCIGCRYCMMACPYQARSFIHENLTDQLPLAPRGKGTVESCTLCVHRIDRDGADAVPACAEAVNRPGARAIWFGDLHDAKSDISRRLHELGGTRLRADLGLNPGVSYQGI